MEIYKEFSQVYDLLMEDTPYDMWINNIKNIWDKYNLKPSLVLDLGCGSGTITNKLANDGYDMIGVDLSEDMLMEANAKKDKNVLYLCQDMREFELYGTVDSIICVCDSINYLLEETDLLKVFKLANNYLNPNGLFIFDMNTEYKFKDILANNTYSNNYDNVSYIWENCYNEETCINEYTTTFFIKEKNNNYKKYVEYHYEKAYEINTVKNLIEKSGLILLEVLDENLGEVTKQSDRIYFVCKEKGKK